MDLFSGVLPFVCVAEAGGFRAAAARLGVTAAAVSKSVARLEAELGVVLLERSSRRVALTPEGTVFLERCRAAIAQLKAGREQVAGAQREPHGTLRVTLPPVLGRSVLPVVARLSARYPRLSIRLIVTNRLLPLAEEEIDVALRMGPLDSSSLIARALRTPRWITVAAPAYLASRGAPTSPADLARHECIKFVLRGKVVEWRFRAGDRDVEIATPSRILLDQSDLLLDAVVQAIGVAQVLDFMAAPLLEAGRIVEVLAPHAIEGPPLHALTPARRASVPRVRVFLDALGDALGRGGHVPRGSPKIRASGS
ncbi:LysR substrate-binding domain-containing protein [Sorangium sp. So ce1335]|uniref:substrate binding domain-containing protein n=1 Tax=Sorangium sp. So ce1335 TaxID=3133335 RepID=UPI003F6397C0